MQMGSSSFAWTWSGRLVFLDGSNPPPKVWDAANLLAVPKEGPEAVLFDMRVPLLWIVNKVSWGFLRTISKALNL